MNGLSDKVAIVTGGATKIGAAVVAAFVEAGARVVVADIDDEGGQKLAVELGEPVRFVRTDITDDAQVAACVSAAVAGFGGVDFLVNLACSYVDNGFDSTREEWLQSYDVNVVGAVAMAKSAHPHMAARDRKSVV